MSSMPVSATSGGASTRFFGWRIAVLATITGALTAPGQTIGVSVFVDPMITDLGLTRSELSFAYLIGTLVGAVALLPVGRAIDRFGARRMMTLIGLAFGGALMSMSGVQGLVTLAIGFMLIRWLGQGSLGLVSALAITPWFERRRGTVFGISFTATAIMMSLAPIILGLTIGAFGWREAWILAAIAIWLIVVPIARFGIIDRPSDVGQQVDGDAAPLPDAPPVLEAASVAFRTVRKQSRFWVVSMAVAATSMLGTGLTFHQISILGAKGLTPTEAAALFLPQAAGLLISGIVVGALADRIQPRYLLALGMLLLATALALVSVIEQGWQVILYAIVVGAAAGTLRPLVATVLPRWYGLGHIGSIQGVSSFIGVGASAIGPVMLALVNDVTGNYAEAALFFIPIPVVLLIATLFVSEPVRRTPPEPSTPDVA